MGRDNLIDFPHYHPDDKATFPPTGPSTDGRDAENAEKERQRRLAKEKGEYQPDPPAVDPSLGDGVDLYDPDTRLTDEQVKRYNPDIDFKQ